MTDLVYDSPKRPPIFSGGASSLHFKTAVCHGAYAKEDLKMIFSVPKGKLRSPRGCHQYKTDSYDSPKRLQLSVVEPAV